MSNRSACRPGAVLASLLAVTTLLACQPAERGGTAGPAVDTASVEAAVDSLRGAFLAAYNAGNAAGLAPLYAADAVFLPANAPPVEGRDSIRAHFDRLFSAGPSLKVSPHEVKPLGPDWTTAGGTFRVTTTPEGAEEPTVTKGSYLILLRQTADGWKLFRHVATYDSVPAMPGAR